MIWSKIWFWYSHHILKNDFWFDLNNCFSSNNSNHLSWFSNTLDGWRWVHFLNQSNLTHRLTEPTIGQGSGRVGSGWTTKFSVLGESGWVGSNPIQSNLFEATKYNYNTKSKTSKLAKLVSSVKNVLINMQFTCKKN